MTGIWSPLSSPSNGCSGGLLRTCAAPPNFRLVHAPWAPLGLARDQRFDLPTRLVRPPQRRGIIGMLWTQTGRARQGKEQMSATTARFGRYRSALFNFGQVWSISLLCLSISGQCGWPHLAD